MTTSILLSLSVLCCINKWLKSISALHNTQYLMLITTNSSYCVYQTTLSIFCWFDNQSTFVFTHWVKFRNINRLNKNIYPSDSLFSVTLSSTCSGNNSLKKTILTNHHRSHFNIGKLVSSSILVLTCFRRFFFKKMGNLTMNDLVWSKL